MVKHSALLLVAAVGVALGAASAPAWAQAPGAGAPPLAAEPPPPPARPDEQVVPGTPTPVVGAQAAPDLSAPAGPNAVQYGGALRARWISVPAWFLGVFLKQKVPLSSWGMGAEFFRRKGDLDIAIGFNYQKMGPPDGNWLGKGKDAAIDTDFISFRNFGFIGVDAAFIWHQRLNEYVGMHYGAGLGLAVVTGQMLRISAAGCTEANAGNTKECQPAVCKANGGGVCTEEILKSTEGGVDNGPADAHRFKEASVPSAIPILNLTLGMNIRFPELKGFEMRFEGGWYDAFFLGGGVGYAF